MVVVVVGPIDHDDIVARVDAALATRTGGARPERIGPVREVVSDATTIRPIEQAHFARGWRAGGLHSDDRYGLAVATQLLGGGWSSRLFQEVRESGGSATPSSPQLAPLSTPARCRSMPQPPPIVWPNSGR